MDPNQWNQALPTLIMTPIVSGCGILYQEMFWRARLGEIQGDVMWCTWWPVFCSVESNKLREVAATCRLWFQYIGKQIIKDVGDALDFIISILIFYPLLGEDEPLFCRFFVLTPSKSDLLCWHRYLSTHLQDFNRELNQTITNPTWHLWVFNATVTAIYGEPNNAKKGRCPKYRFHCSISILFLYPFLSLVFSFYISHIDTYRYIYIYTYMQLTGNL